MPGKIFVNYRRNDDPSAAARVRDGLAAKFGKSRIFMDVDNLLAGQRFDEELKKSLSACDVLIAIIGPRWMDQLNERAAAGERDYVREEISGALKSEIVVIPVRVGREGQLAQLPNAQELPEDIRDLVHYQKHDVTHERFGRDIADLCSAIITVRRSKQAPYPWGKIAAATGALAVAGALFWSAPDLMRSDITGLIGQAEDASKRSEQAAAKAKRAAEEAQREARLKAEQINALEAKAAAKRVENQRLALLSQEKEPRDYPKLSWKMQTVFGDKSGLSLESARQLAARLEKHSNGNIKLEVLPANAIVRTFEIPDAVNDGTVDAGWSIATYYTGKEIALKLLSGAAPLGLDGAALAKWAQSERGKASRDRAYAKLGLIGIPCGVREPRGLWSRRPMESPDDVKGQKMRTIPGLGTDISKRMGAQTALLPSAEVWTALENGYIDGTFGFTPKADHQWGYGKLGLSYYYPAWDATPTLIDLMVSKKSWAALDEPVRTLFRSACNDQLREGIAQIEAESNEGIKLIRADGTKVSSLPTSIVAAARNAARAEIESIASKSELAADIWKSLKAAIDQAENSVVRSK